MAGKHPDPPRSWTDAGAHDDPEVAELLHVSRSTVEDWARRGIVPSKKVGRRRLYIRSKIEALLLDDTSTERCAKTPVWYPRVVPTAG